MGEQCGNILDLYLAHVGFSAKLLYKWADDDDNDGDNNNDAKQHLFILFVLFSSSFNQFVYFFLKLINLFLI